MNDDADYAAIPARLPWLRLPPQAGPARKRIVPPLSEEQRTWGVYVVMSDGEGMYVKQPMLLTDDESRAAVGIEQLPKRPADPRKRSKREVDRFWDDLYWYTAQLMLWQRLMGRRP